MTFELYFNKKQFGSLVSKAEKHPRKLMKVDIVPGCICVDESSLDSVMEYLAPCAEYSKSGRELGFVDIVVGQDREFYKKRLITVDALKKGYRIGIRL